jgi:hypothetical protein
LEAEMKDIAWETNEEKRRNIGLQRAIGALENGWIGNQTLTEMAQKLCPEIFPLAVTMYGQPTIVGKDILLFDPGGGISGYAYTLSGSYSYPSGKTPCSIMVNNGETICGSASHAWLGFKESVIFQKFDGTIGICRAMYDTEIPDRKNVKWAVGGAGLLGNYNPKLEGFSKFTVNGKTYDYSDVWRRTNHTILGIKNGWIYGVYIKSMTGAEMNSFCRDKMKFEYAIKMDGGHIAAINSPDVKINTAQSQGYAIQWR